MGLNPGDPSGYAQWSMSRVRARKVLSDNVNKGPYTRSWTINGQVVNVVASPANQDKGTAVADAVGWRRVNPEANTPLPPVVDVGDIIVIAWEYFKLVANPAILVEAVANAKLFSHWPVGYEGAASFDLP